MRRRSRIDHKILDGFLTRETAFLMAEEVKALVGTMRITVEELIEFLLPWTAGKAVVPVSKFKVGAVCRGDTGNLYFGANIEFAGQSLQTTVHAEQSCIANAMFHGENGIRALAVTATPCGHCRQFLNELNAASALKIQIPGSEPTVLADLLPINFGPQDLKVDKRMLDEQRHGLSLPDPMADPLVDKALQAANTCYAPYTSSFAGVALQTRNGQVFTGHYLENAAFNPGLLPMQACLSNMLMAGRSYPEIDRVVLVQAGHSTVNHVETSQALLKSVTPVPLVVHTAVC